MIIFGWGFTTEKNYGPVQKLECQHCKNDSFFQLERVMTWFTLFFIPVIPYSIKYHFYCPVCRYGVRLDSDKAKAFIPIAELNKLLFDGKITEEEYLKQASLINKEEPDSLEEEVERNNKEVHENKKKATVNKKTK